MQQYREKKKYYPMLVSMVSAQKDSGEEILQKKHKFQQLINDEKDKVTSDEIIDFIYRVEKKYHLQDVQTEDFSRTVREYFFGEITEGNFAKKVSEICNTTPEEALKLLSVIKSITPQNENEKKEIIQLSLVKALEKYPKITGQIITSGSITTKPFLKPLKPTVKNWIIVYEKILGVSVHSMIERGEFVFRSDATKGLTEEERNILLILFKSRDENTVLNINPQEQKIIFIQKQKEKEQITQKNTENIKKEAVQSLKQKRIVKKDAQNQGEIDSINDEIQSNNPQLHKVVNDQKISTQEKKFANNVDKNTTIEQISPEIQSEITKNRIEMKKNPKKVSNENVDSEKIGSQSYQSQKQNNIIETHEVDIQKQPLRSTDDLGVPIQKKDIVNTSSVIKNENLNNVKNKKNKQKKEVTQGNISFSSNHVMPSEKKKKNIKKQQGIHLKPIGYSHINNNQEKKQ